MHYHCNLNFKILTTKQRAWGAKIIQYRPKLHEATLRHLEQYFTIKALYNYKFS